MLELRCCPHLCVRIVGQSTEAWLGAAANSSAAVKFASAINQSFSEQYSVFRLLVQLSAPAQAASAPSTPSTGDHRSVNYATLSFSEVYRGGQRPRVAQSSVPAWSEPSGGCCGSLCPHVAVDPDYSLLQLPSLLPDDAWPVTGVAPAVRDVFRMSVIIDLPHSLCRWHINGTGTLRVQSEPAVQRG